MNQPTVSLEKRLLWFIVVFALALRVGASWYWFDQIDDDADGYRAIARMVVDGKGYANAFTAEPTAFRPPLYPLLLAGVLKVGGGKLAIAAMQILLGTLTVWITGLIAQRLSLRFSYVAPLCVAVDPLSLAYTPRVMTEVCSSLTLAVVLLSVQCWLTGRKRFIGAALAGAAFGLAALCRPTIWAVLPVMCLFRLRDGVGGADKFRRVLPQLACFALGVVLLIGPWILRNVRAVGAPVFATTHGGYTLLLSNNPEFYREVARAEWGTVWDSVPWQKTLKQRMLADAVDLSNERAKDRWHYQLAIRNMRADPAGVGLSAWVKFRRLWSPTPQLGNQSAVILWALRVFYGCLFVGVVAGCLRRATWGRPVLQFAFAMVLAFSAVHLFYWSNARMRTPLVAAISLLAAASGGQRTQESVNASAST